MVIISERRGAAVAGVAQLRSEPWRAFIVHGATGPAVGRPVSERRFAPGWGLDTV